MEVLKWIVYIVVSILASAVVLGVVAFIGLAAVLVGIILLIGTVVVLVAVGIKELFERPSR